MSGKEKQQEQSGAMKVVLVALIVILLLVVGAGSWLVGSGKIDVSKLFEEPEPPPVVMLDEPAFKALEKFVFSVGKGRNMGRTYVAMDVSLVSHHPKMKEQVNSLSSLLKNTMLKFFSGKDIKEVDSTLDNISQLQIDLKHAFVDAAKEYGKALNIEKVLITNVVIQ